MSIIATARVPRWLDLRFAPTGTFPRLLPRPAAPVEPMPAVRPVLPMATPTPCPPWCAGGDACWFVAGEETFHHGREHVVDVAGLFVGERRDLVVRAERLDVPDQVQRPAFVYLAERGEEGYELTPDEAVDLAAALLAAAVEARRAA